MRAVCIGECMLELRANGPDSFSRGYAGDAYNTAVYLKRSAPEIEVQFLTVTGTDVVSRDMREAWRREGIDDSLAFALADGSPGLYLIENDATGERRFQYWRKDSAARRWHEELASQGGSVLDGADLVYFSGISLAILPVEQRAAALLAFDRLKERVGIIAVDPNVRPSLWESTATAKETLNQAFKLCDIALPSTEDLTWLYGSSRIESQLETLRRVGPDEIALTLGAAGVLVQSGELRELIGLDAAPRALDTSGAGDAFNGAYLAARLRGELPNGAARAALKVASRVVSHAGAVVPSGISHPSA